MRASPRKDTQTEQIETCPTVATTLDQLEPIDVAFNWPSAVGQAQRCFNRCIISIYSACLALRAETALAPEHGRAQRSLGGVVWSARPPRASERSTAPSSARQDAECMSVLPNDEEVIGKATHTRYCTF